MRSNPDTRAIDMVVATVVFMGALAIVVMLLAPT